MEVWESTLHYENLINGKWETSKSTEIVVSDMTVLRYKGKPVEWTYILDTYNNSIIASFYSFKVGDTTPYYECRHQLQDIIKKEPINPPIYYHTDQGLVYFSKAYNIGMDNYNIKRSMSRVRTPTDNAIIESINVWIKAEISLDFKPSTYDSIEDFFKEYILYFNYKRPSSKLKYKSPAQYTNEQGFACCF